MQIIRSKICFVPLPPEKNNPIKQQKDQKSRQCTEKLIGNKILIEKFVNIYE